MEEETEVSGGQSKAKICQVIAWFYFVLKHINFAVFLSTSNPRQEHLLEEPSCPERCIEAGPSWLAVGGWHFLQQKQNWRSASFCQCQKEEVFDISAQM